MAFQLGGYLLTRGNRSEFGAVMFLVVPFVSGFAVATVTSAVVRRPRRVISCCLAGGIITFSVLLFTGWEGIVCCVMSLPLVAIGGALGALVGYLFRGRFIDQMAARRGGAAAKVESPDQGRRIRVTTDKHS